MKQKALLHKIYPRVQAILNGYIKHKAILHDIENYITSPVLGDQAGIYGALALAEQAYSYAQEEAMWSRHESTKRKELATE